MEQLPYNPRTRLLSVQYNEMVICLVVDGVSDMVPVPASAIVEVGTRQAGFRSGLYPMHLAMHCLRTGAGLCYWMPHVCFSPQNATLSEEYRR